LEWRGLQSLDLARAGRLVAGAQSVRPGEPQAYGQRITDGCQTFDDVVPELNDLAQTMGPKRQK
jgi:3-deoxy-D-arabino-heptulosonate 7-phosphate (DAHP) synthase